MQTVSQTVARNDQDGKSENDLESLEFENILDFGAVKAVCQRAGQSTEACGHLAGTTDKKCRTFKPGNEFWTSEHTWHNTQWVSGA